MTDPAFTGDHFYLCKAQYFSSAVMQFYAKCTCGCRLYIPLFDYIYHPPPMHSGKTGIIYDSRMTNHRSKRKHPERPMRVKAIIKHLSEIGYLDHPKVEYMSSINREIGQAQLELVHKKKYIKHISTLWPKTSHRTDLTVLDTYFNQHSENSAKVAVGAVLQGIDKVMSGDWENGFAVVRPPGHHSGERNTINGFCVFNNVAVGARYLAERYNTKRVVVFDWDIHHGDGTQSIFLSDPNCLFISIHRYDRGTYYPASEDGHVTCQGVDSGKGLTVNICLDYVNEKFQEYKFQSPGDNDYIYIYHRILEPILKTYDPEFILISSGFDAAAGDPLGGFSITDNGYFYLTRRLMELNSKVLAVLQGGYNTNVLSISTAAVVKALIHDQTFPKPITVPQPKIKELCYLDPIVHKQIDYMIEVLSQNWNILKDPALKQYTQRIKDNKQPKFGVFKDDDSSSSSSSSDGDDQFRSEDQQQEKTKKKKEETKKKASKPQAQKKTKKKKEDAPAEASTKPKDNSGNPHTDEQEQADNSVTNQFYFAAGHMQRFKNFSPDNPKIFKIAPEEQVNFYENLTFQKDFTPHYYGKEHNYIILENLLYQQKDPCVIDIKLSRQSENPTLTPQRAQNEKKKQEKSTSEHLGFRVSGYTTPTFKEGGLMFTSEEMVKKILKHVVTLENRQQFCTYLTNLQAAIKTSKRRYFGTSIVFIKGPFRSVIRWVDFHYWLQAAEGYDTSMVEGLQNLNRLIKELDLSE